jgi:hypothetical protein
VSFFVVALADYLRWWSEPSTRRQTWGVRDVMGSVPLSEPLVPDVRS